MGCGSDPGGADADRDAARWRRPALTLPERLYAARERKGVDLYRAERDTKIRARYLAALERGEYGELQGDVYTKGFLRNYALVPRARPRGGHRPVAARARWRAGRRRRPQRPASRSPSRGRASSSRRASSSPRS